MLISCCVCCAARVILQRRCVVFGFVSAALVTGMHHVFISGYDQPLGAEHAAVHSHDTAAVLRHERRMHDGTWLSAACHAAIGTRMLLLASMTLIMHGCGAARPLLALWQSCRFARWH
jgi:hypothetical protein